MKKLLFTFITACCSVAAWGDNIVFADDNVKAICVANWDTNGDGELSYEEAAAVKSLGTVFDNKNIVSFNELQYFTGLTAIDFPGFRLCSNLTSVTIPNSVTKIGCETFKGTGLTSVTIPSSVTFIGTCAFTFCSSLAEVIIPNSVTYISESAFESCSVLSTITIPNTVKYIGGDALWGTAWLNNQSDGLVYAGKIAYKYKGSMPSNTSITLDDGTVGIAAGAFSGYSNLIDITIPNSVVYVGKDAFNGTTWYNNKSDGMVYAGKVAYKYKGTMPSNTNITLNEGTLGIAGWAFYNCSGLVSVDIPNSVTNIGPHAFEMSSLGGNLILPNSVKYICDGAFHGCYIKNVTIPNSVTYICDGAFYYCFGLTSIIIPNSVTYIGADAFSINGLKNITVEMATPLTINSYVFSSSSQSNATLYVPYGSKAAYEAADNWKNFSKIFEGTKISMSANGICTYANANDLDLSNVSGLTAYIVSSFNKSTSTLTLTPVTEVPAGEGLLLKGEEGDYEVPFTTTDASYTNLLTGVTTPTNISPTNGDETNFILASGKHGIGFYTLSESGILAAGKAYLHLPTSDVPTSRPLTLVYENEPSGIEGISEMEEADRQYFDLQGRRIAQPTKGLYVVNGKKKIIK